MIERSAGVRRLCVCVVAPPAGLLERACRVVGPGQLYVEQLTANSAEIGFAPPGVDETSLVGDLVSALCAIAGQPQDRLSCPRRPVLAAFHVGITRVEGDRLGGTAVTRIRELLSQLASATGHPSGASLAVCMSAGLFEDIGLECGFTTGWRPLAGDGQFRVFPLRPGQGQDGAPTPGESA